MHVAAPGDVGGLESVVIGLATGQRLRGHDVRVLAVVDPSDRGNLCIQTLQANGVPVERLEVAPRRYLAERRMLRAALRRIRPDVVHSHGPRADLIDSGVARGLRLPTVTTVHGSSKMGGLTDLYEWIEERFFLPRFQGVVAVSAPLEQHLRALGIRPERLHTVPNAWSGAASELDRGSAREALGLDTECPVIGWIGRLIPVKGCDVFVRALGAMRDLEWTASIIGDGPDRSELVALAESLGIADRVRFHGTVDRADRVCSAFNLFVLSSRSEGTPMVLFEAIAAGVPVVATTVGGVPDVLAEGTGILVPPETPAELGNALRRELGAGDDSQRRAMRARERLEEEYGAERWLDRYDVVYRQAMRVESARASDRKSRVGID